MCRDCNLGSAMKLWLHFLCFFMFFPYHNFNSNLTMSCKWNPLQEETDRIQQDLGDLQRSRSDGGTSWPWLHWFCLERSEAILRWFWALGIRCWISPLKSRRPGIGTLQRFRGVGWCRVDFGGFVLRHFTTLQSLSSNSMWLMATWVIQSFWLWTWLPSSFNGKHRSNFAKHLAIVQFGHFSLISIKSSLQESPVKAGWPFLGMYGGKKPFQWMLMMLRTVSLRSVQDFGTIGSIEFLVMVPFHLTLHWSVLLHIWINDNNATATSLIRNDGFCRGRLSQNDFISYFGLSRFIQIHGWFHKWVCVCAKGAP